MLYIPGFSGRKPVQPRYNSHQTFEGARHGFDLAIASNFDVKFS